MLNRNYRLHQDRDFKRIWQKGLLAKGRFFLLRYYFSKNPPSRFAVIVSNKTAPQAVQRNKLKRRIKHIIHKNQDKISRSVDMVVIMGIKSLEAKFGDLEEEFLSTIRKIFAKNKPDKN